MASNQDAAQAIIDQIAELAPTENAEGILQLAEAFAWVFQPNNSHGGGQK